jgi:RNA polymerase-associated protein RTF1
MSLDFALDLKHGQSVKAFPIDRVSNAAITQREFERVVKTWKVDKVKLPTKRALETKILQMKKLVLAPMTESDVAAMLARKSQLQAHKPSAASFTLEKARLNQARTLAIRRQDDAELAELDAKLAELAAVAASQVKPMYGAMGMRGDGSGGGTDVLAKVNERNRKANIEAVRQAELRDAEKKRRERRLASSRAGTPGVAGGATARTQDPSARLRTVPRLMQPASPRPGTPVQRPPPSQTSADAMLNNPLVVVSSPTPATPLPGAVATLEARIIDSIEINIGDF